MHGKGYCSGFYDCSRYFCAITLLIMMMTEITLGQPWAYPPDIPTAVTRTYKTVDDIALKVWIFYPADHKEGDRRPAVVFFFGGGWRTGSPLQFAKHCEYLSRRGMVAMAADYRVSSRHGVMVNSCIADAKAAVRWIRKHADELGVDPERIAAAGGSAGGHLAAATATVPGSDNAGDGASTSARPDALILFNPAIPVDGIWQPELKGRFAGDWSDISPYHHLTSSAGPAIIFHGTADDHVPFKAMEQFCKKMHELGNRCELVGYKGEKHAFFNYGRGDNAAFIDTVQRMDAFLVSLGYLKAPPETVHIK